MLDDSYLVRGLDALSRAHATNYFGDGHKGASIVSSVFLCRENEVEAGVPAVIAEMLDVHWARSELCAPFPAEAPDPSLVQRVLTTLRGNTGVLRLVGHNVIFASQALKAFRHLPHAVTPSRVDGVCKLIDAFKESTDVDVAGAGDVPDFREPSAAADLVLDEARRTMQGFVGRGQGWSGHMFTYGQAMIDLCELGYDQVVADGVHAFRQYVARARMGPLDTDKQYQEHERTGLHPLELAYWQRRKNGSVGIGHCFKYPYGFYGLFSRATDDEVKQRCLEEAFRVF